MSTQTYVMPGRARAAVRPGYRTAVQRFVQAAADTVVTWQARADMRRALEDLDDRMLRDIGLGRIEAEREMRKPFWRA